MWLENYSIKLGPFIPEVVDFDNTVAGEYIFELRSNVALDLMTLEVVSILHDNDSFTTGWDTRR